MNERKRKISTCVYVHSNLHHWACILIFDGHFIEYVCWWEFVCEFSEILFFLCIHFVMYFESEMSAILLGVLGHCPFLHYIHCRCDFTSCWIWADHISSLYYLLHHHSHFCFWFIIFVSPLVHTLQRPVLSLILPLHHHYTSHYQFDFHNCLIIIIIFTLGILGSMTHEILCTCCISHTRAWVFYHWVFEPSFPSFLLPYHPSLRYVPCLKTTLRPWDHMSSLIAPTWIGVWDLVDI